MVHDYTCLMFQLVTKYGKEDRITSIVDKYDWYIMPLANPDGYDYSHDKVGQLNNIASKQLFSKIG